jgi:hypothetical protein
MVCSYSRTNEAQIRYRKVVPAVQGDSVVLREDSGMHEPGSVPISMYNDPRVYDTTHGAVVFTEGFTQRLEAPREKAIVSESGQRSLP